MLFSASSIGMLPYLKMKVRAVEARRMIRDGYEPVLKRSRWCLLRRPANLTDHQRVKLRDALRYNLASVQAYLLKEAFQSFWEYNSPVWAGEFLDQWTQQVRRSRIEPRNKFARTMRAHRELLLNYLRARKAYFSGVIEGLNNKAKVTMSKATALHFWHDGNRDPSCAWQTT